MEVHLEGGARRGRGGGNPRGCWTCLSLKLSPEEAFLSSRICRSFWWYQVWSSPGGKAAAIEVCWLVVPRHSYILIKVKIKVRLLYREVIVYKTFWDPDKISIFLHFLNCKTCLWGDQRATMRNVCKMWDVTCLRNLTTKTATFSWSVDIPHMQMNIIQSFERTQDNQNFFAF